MKRKALGAIIFYLGITVSSLTVYASWWPFSKSNEEIPVHAYFYFEGGQESYLGRYVGVSSCQTAAYNYASSKDVRSTNWGYICCTIENGSDCYRKIK